LSRTWLYLPKFPIFVVFSSREPDSTSLENTPKRRCR
jgi:hypothetical protein